MVIDVSSRSKRGILDTGSNGDLCQQSVQERNTRYRVKW